MKRFYRSVWISDVHLASPDSQSEVLYDFLSNIKCDYLYLVGDIIDVWVLKKKWHWPNQYNEVIHKLLKRTRKGAKIIYIPGNHDEFFRSFEGYTFGDVEIKLNTIHETADGRKFLVMHGDEFDTVVRHKPWVAHLGSSLYSYLTTLNRVVNFVRRLMGKPYWSFSGAIKRKVKSAVKFVYRFEVNLIAEAKRREVDGVICGHIHQPALRQIDDILYCNTGDWIENCTALVETESGELEIIWWHKEMDDRVKNMPEKIMFKEHHDSQKKVEMSLNGQEQQPVPEDENVDKKITEPKSSFFKRKREKTTTAK